MACPPCGGVTLVGNPLDLCDLKPRLTTPAYFVFWDCSTQLPDPITPENLEPLFSGGSLVMSSPLGNWEFADPVTQDYVLDSSRPPLQMISGRTITFQDSYAVTEALSPYGSDEYHNYDFWHDKYEKQSRLNYGIVYRNGDFKIARDPQGRLLFATIMAYLNYEFPGDNRGDAREYVNVTIDFMGDPLALTNKPVINLIDAGILQG